MIGRRSGWFVVLAIGGVLAGDSVALAQRPPHVPPGHTHRGPTPQPAHTATPPSSPEAEPSAVPVDAGSGDLSFNSFGAWLDDASILGRGESWLALSVNRWMSAYGRGVDVPSIDASLGVAPRWQLSASVPYSRIADDAGGTWHGFGDLYVTTKVRLNKPSATWGVAVSPTLELLNEDTALALGTRRTHLVLPVSAEVGRAPWRVYGTGGYFTRGAVFASGAVERLIGDRAAVTGIIMHARSTADDAAVATPSASRTDGACIVAFSVTPGVALFGSIGRTLTGLEPDGSRLLLGFGVSMQLAAPQAPPADPPRPRSQPDKPTRKPR